MTLDEAMNLVMILRRRIDLLDVELAIHKAALVRATSRIPVHPQGPREPAKKEVSYV